MISEVDTFSGFWHAIEKSQGATNPKIGKYVVKNWNGEDEQRLVAVYRQFRDLLENHPHFSEEEREIGKNILNKLKVVTQEAEGDWNNALGFFARWFKFGLFDYEFSLMKDKGPAKVDYLEKFLDSYTIEQWKTAFPDESTHFRFSGSVCTHEPKRYIPRDLTS